MGSNNEADLNRLTHQRAKMEAVLDSARAVFYEELAWLEAKLKDSNKGRDAMRIDRDLARKQLEEARVQPRAELDQVKQQLSQAHANLHKAIDELTYLRGHNPSPGSWRTAYLETQKKLDNAEAIIQRINGSHTALKSELDHAQKIHSDHMAAERKKVADREAQIVKLTNELKAAKANSYGLTRQLADEEKFKTALLNELHTAQAEALRLRSKSHWDNLEEQVTPSISVYQQVNDLRNQVAERDAQITLLKKELNSCNQSLAQSRNQYAALHGELKAAGLFYDLEVLDDRGTISCVFNPSAYIQVNNLIGLVNTLRTQVEKMQSQPAKDKALKGLVVATTAFQYLTWLGKNKLDHDEYRRITTAWNARGYDRDTFVYILPGAMLEDNDLLQDRFPNIFWSK